MVSTVSILVVFIILTVGLIIWVGFGEPDSSSNNGGQDGDRVTVDIEPGGSRTISLEISGVTVIIYHDVITISGTYSLALQDPISSSSPSQDWLQVRMIRIEFFDSEGTLVPDTSLPSIINIICFSINDADWAFFQDAATEVQVQFWNGALSNPEWEEISTSSLSTSKRYCGTTDHLSIFALAARIKEAPDETPEPDEPTPTPIEGEGFTVTIEDPYVRLVVPAEAGLLEGSLTMTLEEANLFPEEPPVWKREPSVEIIMIDEEGNEVKNPIFPSPIALCYTLSDEMWERYLLTPSAFEIHFYNETLSNPEWEPIDVVENSDDQELCGAVWHLTLFALAEPLSSMEATPAPYQP